jgi:hypothetical protein
LHNFKPAFARGLIVKIQLRQRSIFCIAAMFFWLIGVATQSAATQSAATQTLAPAPDSSKSVACGAPFPFSAEEFMKKLLFVADQSDLRALPKKFEEAFSVHLHETISDDGRTFHAGIAGRKFEAGALVGCEWYTHVYIGTSDDLNVKDGLHVVVSLGEPPAFKFGDQDWACLRPELLKKMLETDGWTAGVNAGFETVIYRYLKPGAELLATPVGYRGYNCIGDIDLRFERLDQ